jgi:ribonuclease T1
LLFLSHCGKLTPSDFRVYPKVCERSILKLLSKAVGMRHFFGTFALLWILGALPAGVHAKTTLALPIGTVAVQQLPPEGQQTYRLIHQGGPFPFDKDGVVFGNRERILPQQNRGFYREYTVKTPQEKTRGARRIVCGGWEMKQPQNCFYSDDHYTSFREIVDPK